MKKYPPPGKLVDVGGYKLPIFSCGSKDPAVIIDSGLDAFTFEWQGVQLEIAQFAQVITYDRAGIGWSEKSPLWRSIFCSKTGQFYSLLILFKKFSSSSRLNPTFIFLFILFSSHFRVSEMVSERGR
jgi:hypothetical protein